MQSIFQVLVKFKINISGLKYFVIKNRGIETAAVSLVHCLGHSIKNTSLPIFTNASEKTLIIGNDQNINSKENKVKLAANKMSLKEKSSGEFQKCDINYHLRFWQNTSDSEKYLQSTDGTVFTLLSYNILAQNLLESHLYLYDRHDRKALNWRSRFQKLVQEILWIKPQLLCLQEVQESHLNDIKYALKQLDLSVVYKKRTGFKDDGCAILYNNKMFNLVEQHSVEYYQPQVQILNRENVAIIAKFSLKNNANVQFVVATTHLLYNPRRQDVRLAQVQVLLAELDRVAAVSNGEYLPVILTGDFNLQPYSAPYRLLTRGTLKYEGLKAKTLETMERNDNDKSGKTLLPMTLGITDDCQHVNIATKTNTNFTKLYNSDKFESHEEADDTYTTNENGKFESGELRHRFNFSSVYNHHIGSKDQEASTFQNQWVTVDYIFYSQNAKSHEKNKLTLLSRYCLPSVSVCQSMGMVPNTFFGSDHLCLAAKMFISQKNTNE